MIFIRKITIWSFPQIVIPNSVTSLKASLNSFTPIISAVSARSLGPINSTKSSKSTCPPTTRQRTHNLVSLLCKKHQIEPYIHILCSRFMLICWLSSMSSISVGMYPMVLMQFPRSLQPMKPSLSLSNSLKASRSSVKIETRSGKKRGQLRGSQRIFYNTITLPSCTLLSTQFWRQLQSTCRAQQRVYERPKHL